MSQPGKHVFRITIEAPIQQVWETLVEAGKPLPHFFGSVLHTTGLRPGAPIRMRTPDGKYTGVVGEVLEYDPPHRYAHTFRFTHLDDPPCRVTYELREVPDGVEFTLISEAMPPDSQTEKQMIQGSSLIGNTLKTVVETGRPSFSTRMLLLLIRLMQFTTPARCRSEHWPLEAAPVPEDASS